MPHLSDTTVLLQEVSTRDGLQNEPFILSVSERIEVINALVKAGLRRIQIGAFVNPRLVPQMADSELVWQGLDHNNESVLYSVLVLNERGMETALDLKLDHIEIYVSASETHSLKNTRMGMKHSLYNAGKMIRRAREAKIGVTGGIMCAFGCHYEGLVSQDTVRAMVSELLNAGANEIGLADTTGMARPEALVSLVNIVARLTPVDVIRLHLHDTYGYGLRNLEAGLESGIRKFDSSVRGLGGCPFVPGAAGNVATEQVVTLLQRLGFRTAIDFKELRIAASILRNILDSHNAIQFPNTTNL